MAAPPSQVARNRRIVFLTHEKVKIGENKEIEKIPKRWRDGLPRDCRRRFEIIHKMGDDMSRAHLSGDREVLRRKHMPVKAESQFHALAFQSIIIPRESWKASNLPCV
jgi:hypothetical protein